MHFYFSLFNYIMNIPPDAQKSGIILTTSPLPHSKQDDRRTIVLFVIICLP